MIDFSRKEYLLCGAVRGKNIVHIVVCIRFHVYRNVEFWEYWTVFWNHFGRSLATLVAVFVVFEGIKMSSNDNRNFDNALGGPRLRAPPVGVAKNLIQGGSRKPKRRYQSCLLQDASCKTLRIQGWRGCNVANLPHWIEVQGCKLRRLRTICSPAGWPS